MKKVVIVDDEVLVLKLLNRIISARDDVQLVAEYLDAEQALTEIPVLQPDILFLDVDMPELNGIELGAKLLEIMTNKEMAIIYVTAYEPEVIRSFKLQTIHYILKPVDPQSVDDVLKRVK